MEGIRECWPGCKFDDDVHNKLNKIDEKKKEDGRGSNYLEKWTVEFNYEYNF